MIFYFIYLNQHNFDNNSRFFFGKRNEFIKIYFPKRLNQIEI